MPGNTESRLVLDDYRQWLGNDRWMRALVAELEALSLAIADADPRRPAAPPRSIGQTRA